MKRRGVVHFSMQQVVLVILAIAAFMLLLYVADKILSGTLKI